MRRKSHTEFSTAFFRINDALRQLQLVRVVEYSSGKKSMVEIPKKTRDIMQAMKIALPEE